jgi:hypothetical protein
MELDSRLKWDQRWQHDPGKTALKLNGIMVAMLLDRVDGGWLARLEVQRSMDSPIITRRCTSFEAGKRGCEIWAMRHIERLLVECAAAAAKQRPWGAPPA